MSAVSVGFKCPLSGCNGHRDKSGLKNERSFKTAVFADKSTGSTEMASVTKGTRLGPCWAPNVTLAGLAGSELGCPEP